MVLQHIGPVAAARAEAAWLRVGATELSAELGYRLTKADRPVPPGDSDHPYALQAAGRWRTAAKIWQEAGCRYEHAAALAESMDPEDLLAALHILDALGAELACRVRSRLREQR